ncbi:MAG TPA: hypothetical protein VGA22_07880 [Gemmatimonadales bacterium]|jgi:hypothetical protein
MRFIPILGAAVLVLATPVAAQQRPMMGGGMGSASMATWSAFDEAFDSTATAAGLNEDLQNWVMLLMADIREEHGDAFKRVKELRESLRSARASGATREEMGGLMQELGPLMQQLTPVTQAFEDQLKATLSPLQFQAVQAFAEDRGRFRRRPRE